MDKADIIEKMSQEINELLDLNKLIDSDGIDPKELKARLAALLFIDKEISKGSYPIFFLGVKE